MEKQNHSKKNHGLIYKQASECRQSGMSLFAICSELNKNWTTQRGTEWSANSVSKLLNGRFKFAFPRRRRSKIEIEQDAISSLKVAQKKPSDKIELITMVMASHIPDSAKLSIVRELASVP